MDPRKAELRPHPDTPCPAIRRFIAELDDGDWPRRLRIRYRVDGDTVRLRLPAAGPARRTDGLWQHTCFEAFLRADAADSYHEFNFAPSGEWAAYRFASRRGGRSLPVLPAPSLRFSAGPDGCDLSAEIPIGALPELGAAAGVRAGLAAVVETGDGLSYWALGHAAGRPDFHDPATFTLRAGPA